MAMEVDRLTVKVDTDFRGLTSGLASATRNIQGFKKEVEGTQAQLSKGGDFTVRADDSQLASVTSRIDAIRSDAANGATFSLRADESGLAGITGSIGAIRSDAANGATFTLQANESGLSGLGVSLDRIRQDAANGGTFKLDADVTDLAGATTAIQAVKAESASADDTIKITADVDEGAATTKLAAFQGLVSWFDGKKINMPIDINTVSSIAGLFSVQAAVISLGAQLLGLSVSSQIASGELTGLGAAAATAAAGIATVGAAVVAVVTAVEIVQTGISALLGGLLTVGSTAALAATGFGLVAAAGYVLYTMVQDNTNGMGYLSDSLSQLKEDFMTAFEPAAMALAPLAQKLIELADSAMPFLGQQATIATDAMISGFDNVFATIAAAPMMESDVALFFSNMPTVVESLTTAVGNFGAGLFSILAQASPAAAELAEWIQGIAESFFQWTQSEAGRAAIAKWLDDAATVLPAIKDAFVSIVNAFSNMEGFDAETLASGIRGVGTAIASIIGFIDTVKQGWDAFSTAINATLDFIVSWIPEVNLLDKIMGDTGGLDAGALIESLSTVWTTVNDWLAGLAPEVSLWDVLVGDATLAEGAEGGSPAASIITTLQDAYTQVTDWMAGLAPEVSLWDVLVGDATVAEGAEGGSPAASLIETLQDAYTQVTDWMAGLAPEVSLWDVIVGDATIQEGAEGGSPAATLIANLQSAFDEVTDWLANLAPEGTLLDKFLEFDPTAVTEALAEVGNIFLAKYEELKQATNDFFASFYNDYWLYYLGSDGVIATGTSDFFTSLYNDYWLYYFGADGVLIQGVVDFFTVLYNDYWLYYFGADGVLVTGILDFFTVLYNDYWLYYFGPDGVLITGILDFFTVLYNDYWLYYFGPDGVLVTGILDFFTVLYNDYWLYYFGPDGVLITGILDFFTTLYNDYWLYYFGPDGALITPIVDFFTSLYNDYFLYYLGPDGVVVTAVADAWAAILEAIPEFVRSFGNLLGEGLAAGINAGIGYLEGLLTAINAVLTAIGAPNITATLPRVEFAGFAEGGSTESMAAGGSRGGAGSSARDPRHIIWNEGMGEEYWIATGPAADKRKNAGWLAKAASKFGLGLVPMQTGGFAQPGFSDNLIEKLYKATPYIPWVAPEPKTTTSGAGAGATGTATTGEKKLTRRQKKRARKRERRGVGTTTSTATTTMPTSSVPGTSAVDAMPASTAGLAAPAGMTRAPIATGGSKTGRRRGRVRGRTHRGGARFSDMHRGRRRHKRAAGGDTHFMAIGGGTDLGPAGLGERAGGIAQEIMDLFGVWANTYVGGATPHGSLHGNVPENTFDFWADSAFTPLDIATGDAIKQYLYDNYGSELDTVIWNGLGEGPGGAFEDYEHGEHLHASIGGGGILGGAGSVASVLFSKMKSVWDSAIAALGDPLLGDGPLWDALETYLATLPAMAWAWLKSKVPRGTGSAVGSSVVRGLGPAGSVLQLAEEGIEAAGWSPSELSALQDLWQNESGWDANIVNPDSGAYGIPQINPASWPDGPPVGDAAGQIEWGINYIADRYGSPSAALDFWLANGWYRQGGVVPGTPGAPQSAVVHGGERVLPRNINQGFENLAKSVDRWDDNSASGMGGTGANNEAEAVLEEILVELKRGNDNPTPVEVNNVSALKAAFVAGAYAAQDSDLGANITDRQLSEGIRYFMEMQ